MIGKMYRPLKVSSLLTYRGFQFSQKMKSNFGRTIWFEMNIYLFFDGDDRTETIVLEFVELPIPILIDGEIITVDGKGKKAKTHQAPLILKSKRKLDRPGTLIDKDLEASFLKFKPIHVIREVLNEKKEKIGEELGIRAEMTSKEDALYFEMPILSDTYRDQDDWLTIEMKPIVLRNEEYLKLHIQSHLTPIEVIANSIIKE